MTRKLIGGVAAAVVAAVAIWFLFLRGDKDAKDKDTTAPARSAEITPKTATPAKQPDSAPAPRGVAPKWSLDLDPEGPLPLEGQVVGPDGKPIGGATVRLGSVP